MTTNDLVYSVPESYALSPEETQDGISNLLVTPATVVTVSEEAGLCSIQFPGQEPIAKFIRDVIEDPHAGAERWRMQLIEDRSNTQIRINAVHKYNNEAQPATTDQLLAGNAKLLVEIAELKKQLAAPNYFIDAMKVHAARLEEISQNIGSALANAVAGK